MEMVVDDLWRAWGSLCGAGGGMEVFSTQLLNYHLERREEVIKINLGRRSPEKSEGEVELMNFFKARRK